MRDWWQRTRKETQRRDADGAENVRLTVFARRASFVRTAEECLCL
jgi:hypothetical protein